MFVAGYCVGGTNGEGPYLTADEKLTMVSKIRAMIGKDRLLIAGTTCECKLYVGRFCTAGKINSSFSLLLVATKSTSDLSKAAADNGADGVLVMSPFYFRTRTTVMDGVREPKTESFLFVPRYGGRYRGRKLGDGKCSDIT